MGTAYVHYTNWQNQHVSGGQVAASPDVFACGMLESPGPVVKSSVVILDPCRDWVLFYVVQDGDFPSLIQEQHKHFLLR